MSAHDMEKYLDGMTEPQQDIAPALARWFSVSGDVDDFIFFEEGQPGERDA